MNTPLAVSSLSSMPFDLVRLRAAYLAHQVSPQEVVAEVRRRIGDDVHRAWLYVLSDAQLAPYLEALQRRDPATLPLYGLPFAIKDNIDLAAVPTTAACAAYAYVPSQSATVVARLIEAGALPIGKTNLDQFATGLNGTRSPHGACLNAIDPSLVSGGSSSGSAVALALGQVSFALGTDTAGSGRIPAAFNQLVGFKPTRGLLSSVGVVPACRSLDVVSILAYSAYDAAAVFQAALAFDPSDAFSRAAVPHGVDFGSAASPRLGIPLAHQRVFLRDRGYAAAFEAAIDYARAQGATCVEVDLEPLLATGRLLYEGPWVAERYAAIRPFIDAHPEALLEVTRQIISGGAKPLAADAFAAQYQLQAYRRAAVPIWNTVDALLLPSAPAHPSIEEMLAAPLERNSELGWYTNFVNLLDYAAIALPFCRVAGAPFGVTVVARAHQDVPLLRFGQRWHEGLEPEHQRLGATGWMRPASGPLAAAVPSGQVRVAVCGAHLMGEPLNGQLTSRGARLIAATTTAPCYRLYALSAASGPMRPGLVRVDDGAGVAIALEVWELPASAFGSFVAAIPPPLGIGTTQLADGSSVSGFICEAAGLRDAVDISAYGGWRNWRQAVP